MKQNHIDFRPYSVFKPLPLHWIAICLAIFYIPFITLEVSAQEKEEREAGQIASVAATAFNENDFKFAAEQWNKLIQSYPKSKLLGKAYHNSGLCLEKLGKHSDATDQFGKAIPILVQENSELAPIAYFYQGFCQWTVGKELNKKADEASQTEARAQLATAIKTFDDLALKFPNYADLDQALFFQGNAYDSLQRPNDAIVSYNKMLTFPNPHFKLQSLFFLGDLHETQGKLQDALSFYDKFRADPNSKSHEFLDRVNFNSGRVYQMLASQQMEKGDGMGAAKSFQTAEQIFATLAGQGAENRPAEFQELAHEALFQQAFCLANLDKKKEAAEMYSRVASRVDSPFLTQSLVNAGRCYLEINEPTKAIETLKQATTQSSPSAAEAAGLLSQLYLKQNDPQSAFALADEWLKKEVAVKIKPYLLLDRAEAAFRLPEQKKNAPALFMEVVDQFPDHSTAPTALYNAAYAWFLLEEPKKAIEAVDRFIKSYPTNDLIADSRDIKADALLMTDEAAAEKEFDQLLIDFPKHKNIDRWYLRSAVSKFFQKKYQPTIDRLQSHLANLKEPAQIAEANYWVGASHFFLNQNEQAVSNLEKSVAANVSWRAADEALLTLGRACLKDRKTDQAKKTLEQLMANFKDSPTIERAHYFLGESAYESQDFAAAFESFQTVYTNYPKSDLVPGALYNAAWSKMKLNKADESNLLFTRLIKEFPDNPLAVDAKAGRGTASRKSGDMAGSISDLKAFVETKSGKEKFAAMYELAQAQIESKQWTEAETTLKALLKDDSQSDRLGNYHYDLAWTLFELKKVPESLQHFEAITKLTPADKHAAESFFHLATEAYRKEDFKGAETLFAKSVELSEANPTVREKSLYKLGWTFYKQQKFAESFVQFDKQIQQFPSETLAADGYFMRAESLFQQKKYEESTKAYSEALPLVEGSKTVDPKLLLLTRLHGAQSGNLVRKFKEALDLAKPLTESAESTESGKIDNPYRTEAWLEVGTAYNGLNQAAEALAAWEQAKAGVDKTSIRARCSIGDHFFKEKQFARAIAEFKEVYYLYGAENAADEIKAWVAYSLYEAARCNYVQIAEAPEHAKVELINEALKQFQNLCDRYPEDRLAPEAKVQVEKLKKLRK